MANTLGELEGDLENIGPQMKGTVTLLFEKYWQITDENDKTHMFYPTMLRSIGTYAKDGKSGPALLADFAGYAEGTRVTFNLKEDGEMHNVALDASEEVNTLIPDTREAVAGIVGGTESKEVLQGNLTGTISFVGRGIFEIMGQDGKGYTSSIQLLAWDKQDIFGSLEVGMEVAFTPNKSQREWLVATQVVVAAK